MIFSIISLTCVISCGVNVVANCAISSPFVFTCQGIARRASDCCISPPLTHMHALRTHDSHHMRPVALVDRSPNLKPNNANGLCHLGEKVVVVRWSIGDCGGPCQSIPGAGLCLLATHPSRRTRLPCGAPLRAPLSQCGAISGSAARPGVPCRATSCRPVVVVLLQGVGHPRTTRCV